jgi:hypothetical protein
LHVVEHTPYVAALGLLKADPVLLLWRRSLAGGRPWGCQAGGVEGCNSQARRIREQRRALDDVLKLANVPGPRALAEPFHVCFGDPLESQSQLAGGALKEEQGERGDLLAPLPQRGNAYGEGRETVVEILAETPLLHGRKQVGQLAPQLEVGQQDPQLPPQHDQKRLIGRTNLGQGVPDRIDARGRPQYISTVLLPFNRESLRERNVVESDAERQRVAGSSPEQGFMDTLELSEVVRELAQATSAESSETYDLAAKAKLYVRPLRAAQRS